MIGRGWVYLSLIVATAAVAIVWKPPGDSSVGPAYVLLSLAVVMGLDTSIAFRSVFSESSARGGGGGGFPTGISPSTPVRTIPDPVAEAATRP